MVTGVHTHYSSACLTTLSCAMDQASHFHTYIPVRFDDKQGQRMCCSFLYKTLTILVVFRE